MASRRDKLMAAQKKNDEKEKNSKKDKETLVDVIANGTSDTLIINNDTSNDNAGKLANNNINATENAEKSAENSNKTAEIHNVEEKPKNNSQAKDTTNADAKTNIKSKSKKTAINNSTISTLIEINKKKNLKQNRIGFLVTDKALENLERYVEITGFKSKNDLINTILENLDDFLK